MPQCKICKTKINPRTKSKLCNSCCQKGKKQSIETRKKRSIANSGKVRTLEQKHHYSLSKIMDKNPMWKGNNVGLNGLHQWVKRHKSKSVLCECCKTEKSFDLANISQEYKRDLSDWEWLCRRCHMIKDGRMVSFLKNQPQNREGKCVRVV